MPPNGAADKPTRASASRRLAGGSPSARVGRRNDRSSGNLALKCRTHCNSPKNLFLGATRKLTKRTVIIVFIAPKATFTAESGSQEAILRVLRPPDVSNLASGKNVFGHYNRLFPSSCNDLIAQEVKQQFIESECMLKHGGMPTVVKYPHAHIGQAVGRDFRVCHR